MKIFPAIDRARLAELQEAAEAQDDELTRECVDLADTITQLQAAKMRAAEQMRRRKDDR